MMKKYKCRHIKKWVYYPGFSGFNIVGGGCSRKGCNYEMPTEEARKLQEEIIVRIKARPQN